MSYLLEINQLIERQKIKSNQVIYCFRHTRFCQNQLKSIMKKNQKLENKSYLILHYMKRVMQTLMKQSGITKYLNHYFILLLSLFELLKLIINIYLASNSDLTDEIVSISIFGFIILFDFVIVILIRKDFISYTSQSIAFFLTMGAIIESYVQDREQYFRLVGFFTLQQISMRNFQQKNKIMYCSQFSLLIYAQIRYCTNVKIIDMVEFLLFQIINIIISYILYVENQDNEIIKSKKFLEINSDQQQRDQFLRNQCFFSNMNHNEEININNSHNNSLPLTKNKLNNFFDQSSYIENQLNNCKQNYALNFQENVNDTSQEYVKPTQNYYTKNLQSTNAIEYDKNNQGYNNLDRIRNKQQTQSTLSFSQKITYIHKSLNLISTGIVLLNQNKQAVFKNKTIKKFIQVGDNPSSLIQNLLSMPLAIINSNNSVKNLKNNQQKVLVNQQTPDEQKQEYINEILEESKLMRDKQRSQVSKQKSSNFEKYGSVLYNQYDTSRGLNNSNSNFRRLTTVEVILSDQGTQQPLNQEQNINQNALMNLNSDSLSEIGNKINHNQVPSYQSLQVKNKSQKIQINNIQMNQNKYAKDKLYTQVNSAEHILSKDCNQKYIKSNFSPQNTIQVANNNMSRVAQIQKNNFNNLVFNSSLFNGSSLNQEQLVIPKFIQCLIPESIEQIFKNKNLVLEDIVDYLLNHTKFSYQQKFHTDYQLPHPSKDDIKTISNEDSPTSKIKQQKNLENLRKRNNSNSKKEGNENEDNYSSSLQNQDINYDEENDEIIDEEGQEKQKSEKENEKYKENRQKKLKQLKKKKNQKEQNKLFHYSFFIENNYLCIQTKLQENDEGNESFRWVEIKLSCIEEEGVDQKYVLIEFNDINKLKKMVGKQNLDNYKNKILSSVSHELRTPLNCSIQLLDMLSQNDELPPITKKIFVDPALYSNYLLLNIINDILDLAQINYGSFKMIFSPFDLRSIFAECFNLISLQAMQKSIDLELDLDPFLPTLINSDANRLRQVLLNLLNNALKFTQSGSITLRANLIEENIIQIDVEDTGCGIPKKDLSKIIGRFGQTKSEYDLKDDGKNTSENNKSGNAGLGLTIANDLAAGLGGNRKLKVSSLENIGSVFSFCIVNHPSNQIGCTYNQTNLFSKQIINWECFSQYSQQQNISRLKSENPSFKNQNSSSHHQRHSLKKNDPTYNEAAMSLVRFNTELLNSNNINHNAMLQSSVNKGYVFPTHSPRLREQPLQNQNSHNIMQESNRFNKKFQLSIRSNQLNNSDYTSDIISPNMFTFPNANEKNKTTNNNNNNTYGALTQKQFYENITEFQNQDNIQEDESQVENNKAETTLSQHPSTTINQRQQNTVIINQMSSKYEKESAVNSLQQKVQCSQSLPYLGSFNIQSLVKMERINSQNSTNIIQSGELMNQNDLQILKQNLSQADSLKKQQEELSMVNQKIYSQKKIPNQKNSHSATTIKDKMEESCDIGIINQGEQTSINNKPNVMNVNIFQKRKQSSFETPSKINSSNFQQTLKKTVETKNSLNELDEVDSEVIIIKFKDDLKNQKSLNNFKNMTTRDCQNQSKQQLSQIYEKSNELVESIKSSVNEKQASIQDIIDKNKVQIQQVQEESLKKELEEMVTMNKFKHTETYPNNNNLNEKEDIKSKLLEFNKNRTCKCANLLIVDDNEFNLYTLDIRLKSYGFIIDKATSGMSAVKYVQDKFEQKNPCCMFYSLIFMDIDMPIKNGYETTQDILNYFKQMKVTKPTPISACSAYVQESEKTKAKQSGMSYYITKPVNQQMLEILLKSTILSNNIIS